MGKTYYTQPDINFAQDANNLTQGIVNCILERMRYYFCSILYPAEAYSVSKSRFIYADISDNAIRQASSANFFNFTGAKYPFTAFKLGDPEINDSRMNHFAKSWNYFSSEFNSKISSFPMILNVDLITFYTEGDDYQKAISILFREMASKSVLVLPLQINGKVYYSTVELEYTQIGKGNYVWEFEQELQKGKIRDIIHNVKILYHDISMNYSISPVDDIELSLRLYSDSSLIDSGESPETPDIYSLSPLSGTVGMPVDQSPLITFNTPMYESSVEDSFSIFPNIPVNFVWNQSGTAVYIDPIENLQNGTTYTLSLTNNCKSSRGVTMIKDFEFELTTEE